jgi:hypothetical protein
LLETAQPRMRMSRVEEGHNSALPPCWHHAPNSTGAAASGHVGVGRF